MTRNERMKLNALSKEVFGTTSRWQKVLNKGSRVNVKSKRRNGEEVEVGYNQRPAFEELLTHLEQTSKKMADEKELANVGTSETRSDSNADGPTGSGVEVKSES